MYGIKYDNRSIFSISQNLKLPWIKVEKTVPEILIYSHTLLLRVSPMQRFSHTLHMLLADGPKSALFSLIT